MNNNNKKTIKIDGLFFSIVESKNYINLDGKFNNAIDQQKYVLKESLVPKVKNLLQEIIDNNIDYKHITIDKITSKYTKNNKSISIELLYDESKIFTYNTMNSIFKDLMNEYWIKLVDYRLFPFYA